MTDPDWTGNHHLSMGGHAQFKNQAWKKFQWIRDYIGYLGVNATFLESMPISEISLALFSALNRHNSMETRVCRLTISKEPIQTVPQAKGLPSIPSRKISGIFDDSALG